MSRVHVRRLCPLVAIAAFFAASAGSAAQEPSVAQPRVALTYDEQKITDRNRAKLVALLSELVDRSRWPVITIDQEKSLDKVVDNYYDFFAKGPNALPLSTAAAIDEIRLANGSVADQLRPGVKLRIPPVPMRAHAQYGLRRSIRSFDPMTQGYSLDERRDEAPSPAAAAMRDTDAMPRVRNATTTSILLDVTPKLLELQSKADPVVPPQVAVLSVSAATDAAPEGARGYSQIEFFSAPPQACSDAATWMQASPYLMKARERLQRLSAAERRQILDRSAETRLIILDFDFSEAGHGTKVSSIVHSVLEELEYEKAGLKDLDNGIDEFEILPLARKAKLKEVFEAYREEFKLSDDVSVVAARKWIEDGKPVKVGNSYDIPDLVLQAVFWRYFSKDAWLSLSFRVSSPALNVLKDEFISAGSSFAVMAVGNQPGVLQSHWIPQQKAAVRRNFVNVTFGTATGTVHGEFSSPGDNFVSHVTLLAPGCGFTRQPLGPTDVGSSFATPYVAAAVWLKHLLDGTPALTMRRELIAASRPAPALTQSLESGGVFDPALLLANPGPHILTKDNKIVPFKKFMLVADCRGVLVPRREVYFGDREHEHLDPTFPDVLTFSMVDPPLNPPQLWSRLVKRTGIPVATLGRCDLEQLRFTLDGEPDWDLKKFTDTVKEFSYWRQR